MNIQLYGIANCDTVKKARKWLAEQQIDYTWHDFKKEMPSETQIHDWADQLGWQGLLKKTGTTWRQLPEDTRSAIDEASALSLMQAHYNLLKRPLLLKNGRIIKAGFKEADWQDLLS